jgi:hypothetical protein
VDECKPLATGVRAKNWPFKFCAIAYHNIDEEIPVASRRAVHLGGV